MIKLKTSFCFGKSCTKIDYTWKLTFIWTNCFITESSFYLLFFCVYQFACLVASLSIRFSVYIYLPIASLLCTVCPCYDLQSSILILKNLLGDIYVFFVKVRCTSQVYYPVQQNCFYRFFFTVSINRQFHINSVVDGIVGMSFVNHSLDIALPAYNDCVSVCFATCLGVS